jgi:signal transduction histidine kinase
MWRDQFAYFIDPLRADSEIPDDEFRRLFFRESSRFGLPVAGFILLTATHRCFLVAERVNLPQDALAVVTMVIAGLGMLAIFLQFCRGKVPPERTESVILGMLVLAAADIAVFSYIHPNTKSAIEGAQFVAFCFSFIAIRYRLVLFLFLLVTFITVTFSPPGYLQLDLNTLLPDTLATLAVVWLLLRVKSIGIRQLARAQYKSQQKSIELAQTVEQLRTEVEERRKAEAKRKESEEQLRALSRQFINIQEHERAHLSRELHDELGQTLTAARLTLDGIKRQAAPELAESVAETIQLIAESIKQVRGLATELRPGLLDQLGLEAAIQWSVDRFRTRSNLEWSFESTNGHPRFTSAIEAACFRIAQEAMTNAVRHSSARRVEVKCYTSDRHLTLSVQDDGVGFYPNESESDSAARIRLGLLGMRERAESLGGKLYIQSEPGRGTSIEVTFEREPAKHD